MGKKIFTPHIISLSFLVLIILGSLLLSLPISSANGVAVSYLDALFTSTTSVCVTGLVTLPIATTWSLFGKIVIFFLIQIGGLGVITLSSYIGILLHQKFSLSENLLLKNSLNLESLSGIRQFVNKIVIGSLLIEIVGSIGYMIVFIPQYGLAGIWYSVFNSVSAFCNAGIDILGPNSLCEYINNPTINIITMLLIIVGGIGFIVWIDVYNVLKKIKNYKFKWYKYLSLQSKIVIITTFILILIGAIFFFLFEYDNFLTLGNLSLSDKIMASLFQSVTTRTAGFATLPQENFRNSSCLVSFVLMFIGGSPIGTAGGIKTVTFFILIVSAYSVLRGKEEISVFNRHINKVYLLKAITIFFASGITLFVFTILLSLSVDTDFINILYETVSATGTVGLSRNLTGSLNELGKIIIICNMFFGRIGPISLMTSFLVKRKSEKNIRNPKESIIVG